jgi:ribosome-associated toxin RatA of RatAB toxin-antitoxin module
MVALKAVREDMHTENSVVIHAPLDVIYRYASEIDHWPEILPHYRWVRVMRRDGNRRLAEMAARRDWIPVRWTAVQELFPDTPQITYHHVGGITKGMDVVWTFERRPEEIKVSIQHDLQLRWPLIGGWVTDRVIGPLFVAYIAGKTLHTIKTLAERETVLQATEPAGAE